MKKIIELFEEHAWLSWLAITGVFAFLLAASWQCWGNLIIDVGRDFYTTGELLSGKLLYRDVLFLYGPFSPYTNALLCTLFGLNVSTFVLSGLLTIVSVCILLYALARVFLDRFSSTLCVVTFLPVLAFGHYLEAGIFNFVLPYTYPSIHCIALSLAALLCFYRSIEGGGKWYFWGCSAFITATLLTRIEAGVMLMAAIGYGSALPYFHKEAARVPLKQAGLLLGLPLLAAGLVYGAFQLAILNSSSIGSIGDPAIFLMNFKANSAFTGRMTGTDALAANTLLLLKSLLFYAGICLALCAGAMLVARSTAKWKGAAQSIAFILILALLWFQKHFFPWVLQYSGVQAICAVLFFIASREYFSGRESKQQLFLGVLSLFSFLMLLRVFFNVNPKLYGFYLLVPALLCYYIFFLKVLPQKCIPRAGDARFLYSAGFVLLSLVFIAGHTGASLSMYRKRTLMVASPKGAMKVQPDYYRSYNELLEYLQGKTLPSATLVVFPEGLALNFLADRRNPMYHYSAIPPDLLKPGSEEQLMAELRSSKADYVVLLSRSTAEYKATWFGRDYAKGLMRYIQENYRVEKYFGPLPFTRSQLTAVLFRRVDREKQKPI